jgi:NAD(P) transhydrogenase subunit alpha
MGLLVDPKSGEVKVNREDEIIAGCLVCADGEVLKKS